MSKAAQGISQLGWYLQLRFTVYTGDLYGDVRNSLVGKIIFDIDSVDLTS